VRKNSVQTTYTSRSPAFCGRAWITAKIPPRGRKARVSMAGYAIISLGGKQYRVSEGERLLVDRLPTPEGKTFHPEVLLTGGDGKPNLSPRVQVTVKVVGPALGQKILVGKYRRRTGYKRHIGHRAKLTEIEIQSIGARSSGTAAATTEEKPKAAAKPKAEAKPRPAAKQPAAKKTPARKPPARKPAEKK
jgi:large subunit ribosomal protein L21